MSLTLALENYHLSHSLGIHTAAVRCLSIHKNLLLTGSLDCRLALSVLHEDKYTLKQVYDFHSSYVYSCVFHPNGESFFSGDKEGKIYHTDLQGNMLGSFMGHTNVVNSLHIDEGKLVSGSWDSTARVWDIATGACLCVLEGVHTHAVCVCSNPYEILTGSQNGMLNFWTKEGEFVRHIEPHEDIIRQIIYSETLGIVTCSNDTYIKILSNDGKMSFKLKGHEGFVFCLAEANSELISGSDDRTVRVWQKRQCIDTITHPNTVWAVGFNELGDIVTAGGDCFIRVFTKDRSRVASPEEIEAYTQECIPKEPKEGEQNEQALDVTKQPSVEELPHIRGKQEGDIQVFNNAGVGEAYMWHVEGEYWERIGEVVGSQNQATPGNKSYSGDRFFESGVYDYIFDVDLGDGFLRKLPYSNHENPLTTAEKFLARENLNREYLNEIIQFITKNAQPNTQRPAQQTSQSFNKFFPQQNYLYFEAAKTEPIVKKIKEFMSEKPELALQDSEMVSLERLGQVLGNPKGHSGSYLTARDLEVLQKLLHWPTQELFPCIDLFRLALLHPSSQELFKGSDQGMGLFSHLLQQVSIASKNPLVIVGLRAISNMFRHNTSHYVVEKRREQVLNSVLSHLDNQNKSVRLGLTSLIFNFSVMLCSKDDNEGKIQCLTALQEILMTEADVENCFRSLIAIGNLLTGNGINRELIDIANQLGVTEMLFNKHFEGKAEEAKAELINLLSA